MGIAAGTRFGSYATVSFLVVLALAACSPTTSNPPEEGFHLRVLATHDFHGALLPQVYPWSGQREVGGAVALKVYMDRAQEACVCTTLRLDGGDVMQGTLPSNLAFGGSSVAAFNQLGIDAAAIGNHELDWGVEVLNERLKEADFAWLAANVYRRDTGERPAWAQPWTLIERDGLKIGVVGYLTANTAQIVRQATVAPFEFRSGYAAIRDALDAVHQADADFVAIVAHAGGQCEADDCSGEMVELARELPGGAVDLIVGGHTHAPGQGVVNGIPIVRAGANARALAIIDFYRHADGSESFDIAVETTYADAITPDVAMTSLLTPWLEQAEQIGDNAIVTLSQPLSNDPRGDRVLGNAIADAIRHAAEADIGIHNAGGVRSSLRAGPVSYADIYQVLPFGNEIVKLGLNGARLRELIERTGNLFYYSHLNIVWNPDAADGDHIVELRLADGSEVSDEAVYTLGIADFLAEGGGGLDTLASIPSEPTSLTVLDAMVTYLQMMTPPVSLPQEPRVRTVPTGTWP